jgi:hypothetical protein
MSFAKHAQSHIAGIESVAKHRPECKFGKRTVWRLVAFFCGEKQSVFSFGGSLVVNLVDPVQFRYNVGERHGFQMRLVPDI